MGSPNAGGKPHLRPVSCVRYARDRDRRRFQDGAHLSRKTLGETMRKTLFLILLAAATVPAIAAEPLVLREMGSFHVGGRIAEVTGKEPRMIVRQPGGPLTKYDPNGQFIVEQMYVQYFLPQNRKGKMPLLLWHGGGLTGV